MTIQVRGPDGATVNFPDGTPTAVMQRALAAHYNSPRARAIADAQAALGANTYGKGALNAAGQGAAGGFLDEIGGGLAAATTGVRNLAAKAGIGTPAGYGMSDAYHATVDTDRQRLSQFAQEHPATNFGAQLGGGILSTIAGGAALKGTSALGAFERAVPSVLGRSAATGAAVGAINGAGNAQGGLLNRAAAAAKGAVVGGVTGAVVPAAAVGAGLVANKVAAPIARGVARRVAIRAGTLDPTVEASKRVLNAAMKDGVDADTLRQAAADVQARGAITPSTLDLIVKASPTGGQNSMALARGVAMGAGRGQAVQHATGVFNDLQDRAINLTSGLTDDPRTVSQLKTGLNTARDEQADIDYGAFKDVPAPILGEGAQAALADDPGQQAIAAARAGAQWKWDTPRLADLDRMAQGDFSQPVSAGAIDKVQRAFGELGGKFKYAGDNTNASGALMRQGLIGDEIADVPGVPLARANFGNASRAVDASDVGGKILNLTPDQYGSQLAELKAMSIPPEAGDLRFAQPTIDNATQVGARQALTDAIGNQPTGATGVLNRISGATNMGQKLQQTFGDAAQPYQAGVQDMIDQAQTARQINPTFNSLTAIREADKNLIDEAPPIPTDKYKLMAKIANKMASGNNLTDAEHAAIAQHQLSLDPKDLDELLSRFSTLQQAQRAPIAPLLSPYVSSAATSQTPYQDATQ